MLLYTMSSEEIYKEALKDLSYATDRFSGLCEKYKKYRFMKKKDWVFVGVSKYTTDRNNFLQIYAYVKKGGIAFIPVFRVSNGRYTKIIVKTYKGGLFEISSHFLDRWQERNTEDKTIRGLIEETCLNGVLFRPESNEGEKYRCQLRDGICFCNVDSIGRYVVFKTFVPNNMLGDNQKEIVKSLKSGEELYSKLYV